MANTINPTSPTAHDNFVTVTFDGSTAYDYGMARTVKAIAYYPNAAGDTATIRHGSSTGQIIVKFKSVDGGPQVFYPDASARVYVVGSEISASDILMFTFQ